MTYQHLDMHGNPVALPVGKVVCIGQNYQDHIAEMNSKTAPDALFFLKPATALRHFSAPLQIPQDRGAVHNETEIAVLIGKPLTAVTPAQVADAIWGYGLALDLTLRDVQAELKKLGRPWDIAKGFDGACPVAGFVPAAQISAVQQLQFSLDVNGERRQSGDATLMIRGVMQMISEMSQWFSLQPGDIILTGTPAGVGPLLVGDRLQLSLHGYFSVQSQVSSTPALAIRSGI